MRLATLAVNLVCPIAKIIFCNICFLLVSSSGISSLRPSSSLRAISLSNTPFFVAGFSHLYSECFQISSGNASSSISHVFLGVKTSSFPTFVIVSSMSKCSKYSAASSNNVRCFFSAASASFLFFIIYHHPNNFMYKIALPFSQSIILHLFPL